MDNDPRRPHPQQQSRRIPISELGAIGRSAPPKQEPTQAPPITSGKDYEAASIAEQLSSNGGWREHMLINMVIKLQIEVMGLRDVLIKRHIVSEHEFSAATAEQTAAYEQQIEIMMDQVRRSKGQQPVGGQQAPGGGAT